MLQRISIRLTAGILAVLVVGLALVNEGVLVERQVERNVELLDRIDGLASAAGAACVDPLLMQDYPVVQEYLDALVAANDEIIGARLLRADEVTVAVTGNTEIGAESSSRSSDVGIDGDTLGHVELYFSWAPSLAEGRREVQEMRAIFAGLGVGLALFVALFIYRTLQAPLDRLVDSAQRFGRGDLNTSFDIDAPCELGLLAGTLEEARAELAKSFESARRRNEDLEALNRSTTAFLANTSHEIRTPITAILGYSELLVEGGLPPEDVLRHADTIHRSTRNLLRLLDDVLDISKIEAGELHFAMEDCALRQVVQETFELFRVRAEEKGVELRAEGLELLPEWARTDGGRIRQILSNLVGNSVKFTEAGSITIRVVPSEAGESVIFVEDTGIGIAPDALAHLFDRFYQVDGKTTRRQGGVGLGLAISFEIARLMGGEISVTSEQGVGTSFCLRLPMDETDAPEAAAETAHPLPAANEDALILLVEDVEVNRRLLALLLTKAGFQVETASNGQEAIDTISRSWKRGKHYGLILMDVQMPVLDGREATRWLRDHGYDIPIVALSAHAMQGDQEDCLAAGFDGYAVKPISRADLIELASRYLHKEAA